MYEQFKEWLKTKHPAAFVVLRQPVALYRRCKFFLLYTLPRNVGYLKRKYFPNLPSRFSRLKALKGIHTGKKCFIVATGPSLTIEDLNTLKHVRGGGAYLNINELNRNEL